MSHASERLRILIISNLYPPYYIGGYELGCYDTVEHLRGRGHEVCVLTSAYGVDRPRVEGQVYRQLSTRAGLSYKSLFHLFRSELRDHGHLRRLLRGFRPHIAIVFNLSNICRGILLALQRINIPIIFALSDEWLQVEHREDPWLNLWTRKAAYWPNQVMKGILRELLDRFIPVGIEPVGLRHAYFTSRRLKELYAARGFSVASAEIIHWGVDTQRFRPPDRREQGAVSGLLFAGRIHPEKGLLTAVEALGHLKESGKLGDAVLSVVGPVQDGGYFKRIEQTIDRFHLRRNVRFVGKIPRDLMPGVYREHDIFIFPSIWEEPFSIGLLEAMSSGLCVIGTTTGGSKEILQDHVNALTFPAGDSHGLAYRMEQLLIDPPLRVKLGANARMAVLREFDLQRMVDRIEGYIRGVAGP